jgi:AhpD family alkylhydroperoxidase
MRLRRLAVFGLAICSVAALGAVQEQGLSSLADLMKQATREQSAAARIPLAAPADAVFRNVEMFDPAGSGHVPNYLRVLATIPGTVKPYAAAFKTMLYGGTVEPETKMAMALEVGRTLRSPYAVVHLKRILASTEPGRELLHHLETGAAVRPDQQLAVRYAAWLTTDVHGVNDERFRQVRAYFNDAQIVELTMVVSFFNYFTRLEEALNLPVESWALDSTVPASPRKFTRYPARIGLISDEQMEWAARTVGSRRTTQGDGGSGLVNSQRAMNLVPDITAAWRAFTGTTGTDAVVSRELKLHVSFAVSMANGCRYCTLHQVQGLRRLGVSPEKLLKMQKDDTALTAQELSVVTFARKLTRDPVSVTDADFAKLRSEFGDRGALELVLQTCNFAFMNRFTDNLGLPSEDEAIRVYREVYGTDFQ